MTIYEDICVTAKGYDTCAKWRFVKGVCPCRLSGCPSALTLITRRTGRHGEYLRSLNTASMNRTVLSIINQAEQSARTQRHGTQYYPRRTCRPAAAPVQPVEEESASKDGMDDTIMDFLKSLDDAKIDVTFLQKIPCDIKIGVTF